MTTAGWPGETPERGVPWGAPVAGFVAGFTLAVVPAAYVTRVLRDLLPLGAAVLHGDTAFVVALVLAVSVGVATAVCVAARAARR